MDDSAAINWDYTPEGNGDMEEEVPGAVAMVRRCGFLSNYLTNGVNCIDCILVGAYVSATRGMKSIPADWQHPPGLHGLGWKQPLHGLANEVHIMQQDHYSSSYGKRCHNPGKLVKKVLSVFFD